MYKFSLTRLQGWSLAYVENNSTTVRESGIGTSIYNIIVP